MFGCRHKWVEIERFYAAPMVGKMRGSSEHLAQKLMLGVTTILYKCCECAKPKTVEILGKKLKKES